MRLLFIVYLAGLSTLGFLATDMYLPAFNAMQADLAARPSAISGSLSVFLAGFALAQLLWGPLSDRYGRRPILLFGLLLFAVGSLAMLWIDDVRQLLVLRFIQATGVCSAAVIWQALVIDRYPEPQARRVFASVMPLVGLSPALAPLLGAWLLDHFGWRSIFIALSGVTLLLLAPTFFLRRTARPRPAAAAPRITPFTLLKSATFSGNVLIYAACSASFFAWLTGSPFILSDMGYSPADIGLSYVPQTFAFLLGGYGCRLLLGRCGGRTLLPWLLLLYAVSIVALYLAAGAAAPTPGALLLPFCLMALANGAIYPVVVASALTPFPTVSGQAAALQNALQLGLCFLASLLVSALIARPLAATVSVMAFTLPLAALGYYWQRKPPRSPRRTATPLSS